ncbi:tRNA 2'-phosphotransferase 1 [Drosophila eugracilis]|uniref:tRNA 2'-phosphotransferase 1 n=1 Tax=Drosophila eugracilis TaxID=29029 RepID=UPI0007E6E2AC|nr:tRNA 2'-phosphotransferase 1 [Drosophila eugracilis]
MPPKQNIDVQLSKKLSWLLRHGAKSEGIPIQSDGFVSVSDLQEHPRYTSFTLEKLKQIASADTKQRYSLRWNPERGIYEIRANQGHSLPVVESEASGLEKITHMAEVPMAVHGTYYRHWEAIRITGLSRMTRNHVHFATSDKTNCILSGFRSDCQILIYLNVEKVLADGIPIYRSNNNVLLCPGINGLIPKTYFLRVVDRKTEQPLTH